METAVITSITSPYRLRADEPGSLSVSALVESGLRAAEDGDDALADAQIFALPGSVRDDYRGLVAAARERRAAAADGRASGRAPR